MPKHYSPNCSRVQSSSVLLGEVLSLKVYEREHDTFWLGAYSSTDDAQRTYSHAE